MVIILMTFYFLFEQASSLKETIGMLAKDKLLSLLDLSCSLSVRSRICFAIIEWRTVEEDVILEIINRMPIVDESGLWWGYHILLNRKRYDLSDTVLTALRNSIIKQLGYGWNRTLSIIDDPWNYSKILENSIISLIVSFNEYVEKNTNIDEINLDEVCKNRKTFNKSKNFPLLSEYNRECLAPETINISNKIIKDLEKVLGFRISDNDDISKIIASNWRTIYSSLVNGDGFCEESIYLLFIEKTYSEICVNDSVRMKVQKIVEKCVGELLTESEQLTLMHGLKQFPEVLAVVAKVTVYKSVQSELIELEIPYEEKWTQVIPNLFFRNRLCVDLVSKLRVAYERDIIPNLNDIEENQAKDKLYTILEQGIPLINERLEFLGEKIIDFKKRDPKLSLISDRINLDFSKPQGDYDLELGLLYVEVMGDKS